MLKKVLTGTILTLFIAILSATAFADERVSAADEPPVASLSDTNAKAIHKVTVISTFDEDGYTYANFEENQVTSWVAVLQTPLKAGDAIEFPDSQPIINFQSKTLNKPFDKIIFAAGLTVSEPVKATPTPAE